MRSIFDEIHSNHRIFAVKLRSCQSQTDSHRTQTRRCQAVDRNKYCVFCMKRCLLFCNESEYGNRVELSPQKICAQSSTPGSSAQYFRSMIERNYHVELMVNKAKSGSYTLSVKDEFICLASPIFQAQMQGICLSIKELITESV